MVRSTTSRGEVWPEAAASLRTSSDAARKSGIAARRTTYRSSRSGVSHRCTDPIWASIVPGPHM